LFPDESESPEHDPAGRPVSEPAIPKIAGYRVESALGRGGMGVVYKATHLKLGRPVAIKMLLSGIYAGREERTRFMREAKAIAALRHPHIVQVYDVGELDGCPYFTMEFVEGGNLLQKQAGMPQPAKEAARFVAALAGAMQVAHQNGVVHRDLKPSNVLLTGDGTPKITDFGLARRMNGDAEDDDNLVTQSGARVGTPSYMAPEQALGRVNAIGPPADVYALGAILYELLTGRPPFHGNSSIETISEALLHDPVPPARLIPRVPRDLDTICLKCLQKLPERRYGSAGELAADLERFLRGEPILARPVGRIEKLIRWSLRNKGTAGALAAAVALLLMLVAGSLFAAGHFKKMEGVQRGLADEKSKLATEETRQRIIAVNAQARETALREQAQRQGDDLRFSLYVAQMNLAGQASRAPSGIGRVRAGLASWENLRPELRGWEWYYLDGLCRRDLLTLRGHANDVTHVAWSPDGRRVATSSSDGTVKVWDAADGRRVLNIKAGEAAVYCVAWGPDGRRLATAAWDNTAKIWDATNGSLVTSFTAHKARGYSVAWAPDGNRLASGDKTGAIYLWGANDGKVIGELRGHAGSVFSLAWDRDGRRLASSSEDGTARVWDVAALKEIVTFKGHLNWVRQVAWNRDFTRLASVANDTSAKIWDPETGKELLDLRGHVLAVTSIGWSPDGTRLATASEDQTIRLWSAADGAEVGRFRGHLYHVQRVAWSPDGTKLASGSSDASARIWDATAGAETPTLDGHTGTITSLQFSPDGASLASASADGTGKVWDMATHHEIRSTPPNAAALNAAAWSPSGKYVAVAGQRPSIEIWDVDGRTKALATKTQPSRELYALAWSPDNKLIASGGADGMLRVWDAAGGDELRSVEAHGGGANAIAWHADGERIVTGGSDAWVKCWNAATGKPVFAVHPHWSNVKCVTFSPDGKWIASASADQTVAILSAATGAISRRLMGHTSGVNVVAWSPDGARIASCGEDQTVRIWDASTGKEMLTLDRAPNEITALAWSPDGMQLAVGDIGRRIAIYDATPGYVGSASPWILPMVDARLAADPKRASDWRLRSQVDANAGKWDDAAHDARQYLSLNPDARWFTLAYWLAGPYAEDFSAHFPPGITSRPMNRWMERRSCASRRSRGGRCRAAPKGSSTLARSSAMPSTSRRTRCSGSTVPRKTFPSPWSWGPTIRCGCGSTASRPTKTRSTGRPLLTPARSA
jgi:WD40 repeat protein